MSKLVAFVLSSAALVACGGNSAPAAAPTTTSSSTDAAPSTSSDSGCKEGAAPATATDLDACLAGCEGLESTVPSGAKCLSAKASCTVQCNTKFKK